MTVCLYTYMFKYHKYEYFEVIHVFIGSVDHELTLLFFSQK